MANDVPVQEGEDTILVFASDVDGKTAEESIAITVLFEPKRLDLRASLESGLAPMETKIIFESNFSIAEPISISYTGPTTVEFHEISDPDVFQVKVATPGIYYFKGTAKDTSGDSYTDTVAILAVDRTALDALLQAKWNGMKNAMIAGDIEGAVSYFAFGQQETCRQVYGLVEQELPQIATDMQPIEIIYQKNNRAEYRLRKDIVFKGEPVTVTFYVYFQREPDGIWRIWDY